MDARLSYREGLVRGASPLRLVVLLYEQAIEDLRRALRAHLARDIEGRTREINHALVVIGHLQSSLDRDLGGGVASQLEVFYNQVRAGLMEAQAMQSVAGLEQQMSHLMLVREAWDEVELSGDGLRVAPAQTKAGSQPRRGGDWNG
jgi:flagellar protein FliS